MLEFKTYLFPLKNRKMKFEQTSTPIFLSLLIFSRLFYYLAFELIKFLQKFLKRIEKNSRYLAGKTEALI